MWSCVADVSECVMAVGHLHLGLGEGGVHADARPMPLLTHSSPSAHRHGNDDDGRGSVGFLPPAGTGASVLCLAWEGGAPGG